MDDPRFGVEQAAEIYPELAILGAEWLWWFWWGDDRVGGTLLGVGQHATGWAFLAVNEAGATVCDPTLDVDAQGALPEVLAAMEAAW